MTRREAMGKLLAKPRDHADMGKIGRRVLYDKSDGRERLNYCVRVLRTLLRRSA